MRDVTFKYGTKIFTGFHDDFYMYKPGKIKSLNLYTNKIFD